MATVSFEFGAIGKAHVAPAGSTQSTATPLQQDFAYFPSVPSGSGIILKPSSIGDTFFIQNADPLNPLNIYPPLGGTINGGSVNSPLSLPAGSTIAVSCFSYLAFGACGSQAIGSSSVVSIASFGAKGDGSDATAAIVSALNSGAKDIYAPPGDYVVTSSITIPANVTFHGVLNGYYGSSKLIYTGTGVAINNFGTLKGFEIQRSSASKTGTIGINWADVTEQRISDVLISNFAIGIQLSAEAYSSNILYIDNSTLASCDIGLYITGSASYAVGPVYSRGLHIAYCNTGILMDARWASGLYFSHLYIELCNVCINFSTQSGFTGDVETACFNSCSLRANGNGSGAISNRVLLCDNKSSNLLILNRIHFEDVSLACDSGAYCVELSDSVATGSYGRMIEFGNCTFQGGSNIVAAVYNAKTGFQFILNKYSFVSITSPFDGAGANSALFFDYKVMDYSGFYGPLRLPNLSNGYNYISPETGLIFYDTTANCFKGSDNSGSYKQIGFQAAMQPASTATDIAGLKTDLNTLIANLKNSGLMSN